MATQSVSTAGLKRRRLGTADLVLRLAGFLVALLTLLFLGSKAIDSPSLFIQSVLIGLQAGALYALIALGYTLVYGIIELINFAHGDLFALGAVLTGYVLNYWLGLTSSGPGGWAGFLLTLIVIMTFCAIVNVTIEFLAYRRLRRAPRLAPLITAVGMSFILQGVILWFAGSTPKQWNSVLPQKSLVIGDVTINYSLFYVAGVTIPLLLLLTAVVQRTKQGKAMRATAQDQDAARLMGINVNRTISFTFAIGGAMAGAAGVMYNQTITSTNYRLGLLLGLYAFTAAVVGGIGNLNGAVLGGVLIGLIQGINEGVPGLPGTRWTNTVIFSVLIVVMVFKPEGILGKAGTEKV